MISARAQVGDRVRVVGRLAKRRRWNEGRITQIVPGPSAIADTTVYKVETRYAINSGSVRVNLFLAEHLELVEGNREAPTT